MEGAAHVPDRHNYASYEEREWSIYLLVLSRRRNAEDYFFFQKLEFT